MRKKILIINGSADLYGANRILALTIDSLIDSYDISLFLPRPGPLIKFISDRSPGVRIQIVPEMPVIERSMRSFAGALRFAGLYSRFYMKLLLQSARYRSYDLIFINTLSCTPLICLFKSFKFKVLVHVHEILSNQDTVTRLINRLALKYSDAMIAVSSDVKTNLLNACHTLKERQKISMIQNGIPDMFEPAMQVENKKLIFSLFGRIKPEKGQWYLLEAIKKTDPKILSKAVFRVIGSPTLHGTVLYKSWLLEVEALKNSHSLNIEVIGFVNDISTYLNETDVVLVPSLMQDPFPTVILEGLSAGKIVLASNSGGSKESIQDGVNGILMDTDNAGRFSELIISIIQHPDLYAQMKIHARESYLQNFTVSRYKANILDLIVTKFLL